MVVNIQVPRRATDLVAKYQSVKNRYADRDQRHGTITAARENRFKDIAPGVFGRAGLASYPIIANMIDVAARDMAEQISALPQFKCESARMVTERDQNRASKRTKIANSYIQNSDVGTQLTWAADWLITYALVFSKVDVDWSCKQPRINLVDPRGIYPTFDALGRLTAVYERLQLTEAVLCEKYPEYASVIKDPARASMGRPPSPDALVEIVVYSDKDHDVVFMPSRQGAVLSDVPNRLKRLKWAVAKRPGLNPDDPRGQFDDVVWPHIMRQSMSMMKHEATSKSVRAPIMLPNDVPTLPLGPDAVIRTSNPAAARRLSLDVPSAVFQEDLSLKSEIAQGSRYPESRSGNAHQSIVTGRGVEELQGGFDSQIASYQGAIGQMLQDAIAVAFEMDETLWPLEDKAIRGKAEGSTYEITYQPGKDIKGDYTVDVSYGLGNGMDPNRAMIFGLQGMSAGIFAKDTVRRQIATGIDVQEEERKIAIETMEQTMFSTLQQAAMALPAMAQQGADVTNQVLAMAEVLKGTREGKPVEELVRVAFQVKSPAEQKAADKAAAEAQAGGIGAPGDPNPGDGVAQQLLPGQDPMQGLPGSQPQGRPDLMQLMAGFRANGDPNMQANVNQSMVLPS